jgi:gas vesicle protein
MVDVPGMQAGGGIGSSVGGIVGGIATLLGAGGSGGDRQRKKIVQAWEKLQAVDFDMSRIPEADLKMLATMAPDLVEMVLPLQTPEIQDSITGRGAQTRSLSYLERLRDEGMPLSERAAAQGAMRQVAGAAKGADEAVLQDLGQRGRLGSGDEASARLIAGQNASDLAGVLGQSLAVQGEQNRLAGAQGAANLGGAIRSGDVDVASRNAAQNERYNALVASILNTGNLANQQAKQQAQEYNVGTRQRVGEEKALNRQATATQNIQYPNQLRQQSYDNELQKLRGYTGALAGQAQSEDEKRRAREQAIYSMGSGAGGIAGSIIGGGMI